MAMSHSDESSLVSCFSSLASLEVEDVFLTELLGDKPESPRYICRGCEEGNMATSRCRDCSEVLCDNCVRAHLRVRLTKDHYIHRFDETGYNSVLIDKFQKQPNSVTPPDNNTFCDLHFTEVVTLFCETCTAAICGECCVSVEHKGHSFIYLQDAIDNARTQSKQLLIDMEKGVEIAKKSLEHANRMIESVNVRAHLVAKQIRTMMRKFHIALEKRERELIDKLETIRMLKGKVLLQQMDGLRTTLARCARTYDYLSDALESGSNAELFQAKQGVLFELNQLRLSKASMEQPHEDDYIHFKLPDSALFSAVANIGSIISTEFAGASIATGDGTFCAPIGKETICTVITKNHLGEEVPSVYNHNIQASLTAPDGTCILADVKSKRDGTYQISYMSNTEGMHKLQVTLRGKNIYGSPYTVNVCNRRNYIEAGPVVLTFSREGNDDGDLCRPWGVCCDHNKNIIVADRSNNRIQIFTQNGTFIRKFGSHGSEPGQFDRPAGVAVDRLGRIVVADKDNHRVQVFTITGIFVYKFGEKGSKNGQFNYPWDVDVDTDGRIVVSDTRNHRIQLFSSEGVFLGKYGFESTSNMWKHFDSPRGVCFGFCGMVVVTDFNNHRLVVIDQMLRNARFLGCEGSNAGEFLRPQGVVVDNEGHIIVADSRNNRIQVFKYDGNFLWQFGSPGKESGQLDRPSGICLTPEGMIVVVDFGNNRIQIF